MIYSGISLKLRLCFLGFLVKIFIRVVPLHYLKRKNLVLDVGSQGALQSIQLRAKIHAQLLILFKIKQAM